MKIDKHPIVPQRVRRPPHEGWSWIDRRFLRHHAEPLCRDAITLYFFLAAVGDKHGMSFYGDATTAAILRIDPQAVRRARDELVAHDLVAHRHPFTQVLSLPGSEHPRPTQPLAGEPGDREPARLGDIMRELTIPRSSATPGGRP